MTGIWTCNSQILTTAQPCREYGFNSFAYIQIIKLTNATARMRGCESLNCSRDRKNDWPANRIDFTYSLYSLWGHFTEVCRGVIALQICIITKLNLVKQPVTIVCCWWESSGLMEAMIVMSSVDWKPGQSLTLPSLQVLSSTWKIHITKLLLNFYACNSCKVWLRSSN